MKYKKILFYIFAAVLNNKPPLIKEIRVHRFGWQFAGQLAEINSIGNKGQV